MTENEIASIVVNSAYCIHKDTGPGLLESVYEEILAHELKLTHLKVDRQVPIPVVWKDVRLELGFRADLIVSDKLLIEIKSVDKLAPVHFKQVQTYLKLTGLKLGLLINFNEGIVKSGIKRVVNQL